MKEKKKEKIEEKVLKNREETKKKGTWGGGEGKRVDKFEKVLLFVSEEEGWTKSELSKAIRHCGKSSYYFNFTNGKYDLDQWGR